MVPDTPPAPLVALSELRFNYLPAEWRWCRGHYDVDADILMFTIMHEDRETVVHYLDEHVGLLYDPATKIVVGVQVEGLQKE